MNFVLASDACVSSEFGVLLLVSLLLVRNSRIYLWTSNSLGVMT